eukprot:SAG31_NODE_787_length_12094_cov_27.048270_6_plen_209_part_00
MGAGVPALVAGMGYSGPGANAGMGYSGPGANYHDIPKQEKDRQAGRKLFVGGLAQTVKEADLKEHFSRWGTVEWATVHWDRATNRSKGFGFVTYVDEQSMDAAMGVQHMIHDKQVELKRYQGRETRFRDVPVVNPRIFVGGLPQQADEKVVREYFQQFGAVQETIVHYDKVTGNSKGYAFVTFLSTEEATAVHNRQLQGMPHIILVRS